MPAGDSHGETPQGPFAYGPVPSRRLGRSLGINNIPAKACTYGCVYCQVGRTARTQLERRDFHAPADIHADVQRKLEAARAAGEPVDYLTFVPDGEPTLDLGLGRTIALLKSCGVPIGVITNASLLWRQDVRDDLAGADWVSLKVDAVRPRSWRRINRGHRALVLDRVLAGIGAFAAAFTGELVTETMLVKGLNDDDDGLADVAAFLRGLRPARAYLGVPTRPPAEPWVRAPEAADLNRAYQILAGQLDRVEYLIGYEGDAFAATGDPATDLLGITAVHPMRKEAVGRLLTRSGAPWAVVEELLARGDLVATLHEGHTYYLRRFAGRTGGPS